MTEDEMVGGHHQLDGHEFDHTLGDTSGQGGLAFCSPWDHRESDTSQRLDNNDKRRHKVQCTTYETFLPKRFNMNLFKLLNPILKFIRNAQIRGAI